MSYSAEPARVGPDYKPILPADRTALKSNILPLLAASPSRVITVQLASTLKTLISNDFPEKWPDLLDAAKALLASNSIREVGAGTVVVLEMVRAFRCVPPPSPLPPYSAYIPGGSLTLGSADLDSARRATS